MKHTKKRCFRVVSFAITVATMFFMGSGLSEAQKAGPALRAVRTMRAPAVSVQSFGVTSGQTLQRSVVPGSSTPGFTNFSTFPSTSAASPAKVPHTPRLRTSVRKSIQEPTVRLPRDPFPDPSDIIQDMRFPNPVDGKWLGGPDREPPRGAVGRKAWVELNRDLDISGHADRWDPETVEKVRHWGGGGQGGAGAYNPLIGGTRFTRKGGKGGDKGSGGTDSGGEATGKKETDKKETGTEAKDEKPKPVSEETGKPDATRGEEEGDDPDEFRSPVSQEAIQRNFDTVTSPVVNADVDMVAGDETRGGSMDRSGEPTFQRSGTNTPTGLPSARRPDTIGPNHENRPDVSGTSLPTSLMADPMGVAASPAVGPDGPPGNPDPGPKAGPAARSAVTLPSASGGTTMTNPMGNAMSPVIGDDGGKGPGPVGPK